MPQTQDDIAKAVAGATGPLRIIGGGTRPIGRPVVGEALSVAGLSGITLYEPGALTLVAQAGTPVAEIETALMAENQRLAFEPMDHRALLGTSGVPTIGGIVAGNVSGSRRISVGACRDFMLGVRYVDGSGKVVKNGGRVMKNVTGYDLVKLMCGSYGTLGVLTEVSLKVMPRPETSATLTLHGLGVDAAVAAMSNALGSPFELTGAAYCPAGDQGSETHLRIEGFAASVAYRLGRLKDRLGSFGEMTELTDAARSEALWQGITNVDRFAGGDTDIWRLSVRPSDAPAMVAALPQGAQYALDWGGGLIWVATARGSDLRAALGAINGHATLIRGTADSPHFQPEAAPLAAVTAGLRAKFDPRGILNPGIMI